MVVVGGDTVVSQACGMSTLDMRHMATARDTARLASCVHLISHDKICQ